MLFIFYYHCYFITLNKISSMILAFSTCRFSFYNIVDVKFRGKLFVTFGNNGVCSRSLLFPMGRAFMLLSEAVIIWYQDKAAKVIPLEVCRAEESSHN